MHGPPEVLLYYVMETSRTYTQDWRQASRKLNDQQRGVQHSSYPVAKSLNEDGLIQGKKKFFGNKPTSPKLDDLVADVLNGKVPYIKPSLQFNGAGRGLWQGKYINSEGKMPKTPKFSCGTSDYDEACRVYDETMREIVRKEVEARNGSRTNLRLSELRIFVEQEKQGTGRSSGALKNYRAAFHAFIDGTEEIDGFGDMYLNDVTRGIILTFLKERTKNGCISSSTFNNYKGLKQAFAIAIAEGFVEAAKNPFTAIALPKVYRREVESITEEELHQGLMGITVDSYHQLAIIEACKLSFYGSLRPAEMRRIRVNEIDLNAGTLDFRPHATESIKHRPYGILQLCDAALEAIRSQLTLKGASPNARIRNSEYLFATSRGTQPSERTFAKWVEKVKSAAWPEKPRLILYSFHHGHASLLTNDGATDSQVAYSMGQRSSRTTYGYLHLQTAKAILPTVQLLNQRNVKGKCLNPDATHLRHRSEDAYRHGQLRYGS